MQYFNNCVNWDRRDIDGLTDMINNNLDISRKTFLKHIDKEEIQAVEDDLGYAQHPSQGLTMAGDYHISYHRSKLHGKRCYYFCHSGIEYVFI